MRREGKKGPPRAKKVEDPKVRQRAEELMAGGMPRQMALAVARGKLPLATALERLVLEREVQRLMDREGIPRALANQIAVGHASLEQVLFKRRLQEMRELNQNRSCLDEAVSSGKPLTLLVHGQKTASGVIVETLPFGFSIRDKDGAVVEMHKLQAKIAYPADEWKNVRRVMRVEKGAVACEPIPKPQDRYSCADKRLFRYVDQKVSVEVTTLEGEQFRGTVTWFGRYEFGLSVKRDVEIFVFRHAVKSLVEV